MTSTFFSSDKKFFFREPLLLGLDAEAITFNCNYSNHVFFIADSTKWLQRMASQVVSENL